jgi:hypothetical protein
MRAIFQSLPGLIDEMPNGEVREAVVFAVWPTVLGEHLRGRTAPISFENEILTVAVSNADWKRELKEHAPSIIYKLNRTFGRKLVERIELIVDSNAVEQAMNRKQISIDQVAIRTAPNELNRASTAIADVELRKHFLEAAAACIEHRDAK